MLRVGGRARQIRHLLLLVAIHPIPVGVRHGSQSLDAVPLVEKQILHPALHDAQILLRPQQSLHRLLVQIPVHLPPRPSHGRSLPPIQYSKVYPGAIGRLANDAPQRVDLPDEVSLSDAADGRVAAQFSDRVGALGDEGRAGAGTCGRGRGVATRVSAPDDNHVKVAGFLVGGGGKGGEGTADGGESGGMSPRVSTGGPGQE
mmetsp:Transcript_50405/g.151816  ORF Transcript_50405/g.151816 Transcript_50405/m.151816 type:complete len:202 (+) Transcript_50405:2119-2724(+)